MTILRALAGIIPPLRDGNPAIAITGPRQSGKTTLCQETFKDLPYVNLESPVTQAEYLRDPLGFLSGFPDGAVFDEVHHVPDLLSFLQVRIDEDRRMGRWVLSGSQQIGLSRGVSQSLAGRVAHLDLLPFSRAELVGAPRCPPTLEASVLVGGYPPLFDEARKLEPARWLDDYITTFIHRDVREILDVRSRTTFDRFLRLCAARSAQLVNMSDLARDCGVDHKTIKAWLGVLEACYVIRLVHPHFRNFGKRLVRTPKLYFLDCGLACRLLHIRDVNQLKTHPLWGNLAETWFVSEVMKTLTHRGRPAHLWFWRSQDQLEVDLVIEQAGGLLPIEIKTTSTPSSREFAGIVKIRALSAGDPLGRVLPGFILYGGEEAHVAGPDRFVPWHSIDATLNGVL